MVMPISFLDWIEDYRTSKKDKQPKSKDKDRGNRDVKIADAGKEESNGYVRQPNGNYTGEIISARDRRAMLTDS